MPTMLKAILTCRLNGRSELYGGEIGELWKATWPMENSTNFLARQPFWLEDEGNLN